MKLTVRLFFLVGIAAEIILLIAKLAGKDLPAYVLFYPLIFLGVAVGIILITLIRDIMRSGSVTSSITDVSRRLGVPRKALALWCSEVGMLYGVTGLCTRNTGAGEPVSYHRALTPVFIGVLLLGIVEAVVVHLVVSNGVLGVVIAILSVYAIVLFAGFYGSMRAHPHLLNDDGSIQVRLGTKLRCFIEPHNIAAITKVMPGSGGAVEIENSGCRAPVLGQVNVQITCTDPVVVEDISLGVYEVTRLDIYCDQPDILLAARP
ncbi:hypothetical protein [Corynebacterium sp. TAE3-ERU30]|uniref:hypothetical protein n=1 Tax=Corynebacterium sp. TAE3-ERU30 TaxID=2849496 RepID=UPI001C4562A7|nr:hypothetical protein [Corynebacterium sp. TAE3-ERU30]MBV7282282.1 hypothetical protein [Corynebacterium sp. TAE3-ERU30]